MLRLVGSVTAAAIGSLIVPAAASAAPFAPATTISGFGNQPALAQVSGAAIDAGGGSVVAGTGDNSNNRRAVAAFGTATASPSTARGFGPSSGAFDLALATNGTGNVALTFTVGHVAYLVTCRNGSCRPTARVGTSSLKPQSAVAVEPASGRTIVMWRGRTSRGTNRLQWRITTNGRLGSTHTLGEFGDTPQLATDASGRTVAVWVDRRSGRGGVRTASRRVGEFTTPSSVTTAPAADLRLVTSDGGTYTAAWLTAPGGVDVESPAGTVQASTRTRTTAFRTPQSVGMGSTVSLAGSPDGHALLAVDRHVGPTSVVVSAARRTPGGPFGAFADVAPAQFVSDAFGAQAAIADSGIGLVSWASGTDPSAPSSPSGAFAAMSDASGTFGAPQPLAGAQSTANAQPTAPALGPTYALVAWGTQVARAALP